MKKVLFILLALAVVLTSASVLFATGLNHNVNQSAEFIGMLNRNASTDLDAVFYNPAGTTVMSEGLHLYLSNQSIFQTRTLDDDSGSAAAGPKNQGKYEGETAAWLFPNFYAVYKTGQLSFFAGFAPVGGGGTADFKDGLPIFYWAMAGTQVNAATIITSETQSFKGSSTLLMGQAGAAYAINPMISVAVGGRYAYGSESYEGTLAWQTAGAGAQTVDFQNDRSGSCYGGLFGVNVRPMEGLNIGIRYEWYSVLEMENETTLKTTGPVAAALVTNPLFGAALADFSDGEKSKSLTLPQILAIGASYQIMPGLTTQVSFTYAFNKQIDVEGADEALNNSYDVGIGFEYLVMQGLKVRAGYLYGTASEKDEANSELSYGLASHTFGLGGTYTAMPGLDVILGFSYTMYPDRETDSLGGGTVTLGKVTYDIAIGVSYKAF